MKSQSQDSPYGDDVLLCCYRGKELEETMNHENREPNISNLQQEPQFGKDNCRIGAQHDKPTLLTTSDNTRNRGESLPKKMNSLDQ